MPDNEESRIVDWLDDLKRYARAFHGKIGSIDEEFKDIVKYDESIFEKVFVKYCAYRREFHTLIKGDLIDRHKIVAALMLAATEKENLVFKVDYEAIERSSITDFPYWVLYPNEYYLCKTLLRILTECVLASKKSEIHDLNEGNYFIRIPDKIIWWERDIIEPYTNQFCQLLSILIMKDDISVKCSLLASHLIYFYELAYDCAVKGLSRIYYNMTV